ncbi:MAG: F0F1 ATP synthase subunit delta [Eubacteriales bacterium]|nr:F0F1 ATP synthase subunit delta [Eubacteriales bacterium]
MSESVRRVKRTAVKVEKPIQESPEAVAMIASAKEQHLKAEDHTEEPLLRGRIITGMPLSVAAQKRIGERFEELTGRRVRFTCRLDKKQIAGIRVELNGYCYDGTLRGQLLEAQRRLKSHSDVGKEGEL